MREDKPIPINAARAASHREHRDTEEGFNLVEGTDPVEAVFSTGMKGKNVKILFEI